METAGRSRYDAERAREVVTLAPGDGSAAEPHWDADELRPVRNRRRRGGEPVGGREPKVEDVLSELAGLERRLQAMEDRAGAPKRGAHPRAGAARSGAKEGSALARLRRRGRQP